MKRKMFYLLVFLALVILGGFVRSAFGVSRMFLSGEPERT
jgi:hypothetical protein